MPCPHLFGCRRFALLFAVLAAATSLHAEPRWIRIDSSHFSVFTDADEPTGHQVLVRFEQMRAVFGQLLLRSRVNLSEPVEIIALKSADEFSRVAPAPPDEATARGGFFVPGEDRDYFVLDVSRDQGWRAVSRDFAAMLLSYNYPPAQAWFDEGFSQYFSSLLLNDKQMTIGGDPLATQSSNNPAKPFVEVLSGSNWLSLTDLFTTDAKTDRANARHTLFPAQSWIVMHYLLNTKDKLPATGAYFGLVENEHLPVEEAIQKAYGMASAQMEQAVKEYFQSLVAQGAFKAPLIGPGKLSQAAPVASDDVGSSTHDILPAIAPALVAEMSMRVPEHREQARKQLEAMTADPKTDNAVAHRALAWDALQRKEFETAVEQLGDATALDAKDPWVRYYLALTKHRMAQSSGHPTQGLANMMEDLHAVLGWDPQFAEADSLLAMAQREGGGLHAATDSVRAAIQLNPRNQHYLLELAQIYLAGKNWDAATALLERLTASGNAEVAAAARQNLQDLPYLKKYGVPPMHEAASPAAAKPAEVSPSGTSSATAPPVAKSSSPVSPHGTAEKKTTPKETAPASEETSNDEAAEQPAQPQIDKRPIQYTKGKLISVDCSSAPAAVVTVSVGAKTLKLHAPDYKALPLIGADQFSCDWTNRLISVNYKARANGEGDLVSLEIR